MFFTRGIVLQCSANFDTYMIRYLQSAQIKRLYSYMPSWVLLHMQKINTFYSIRKRTKKKKTNENKTKQIKTKMEKKEKEEDKKVSTEFIWQNKLFFICFKGGLNDIQIINLIHEAPSVFCTTWAGQKRCVVVHIQTTYIRIFFSAASEPSPSPLLQNGWAIQVLHTGVFKEPVWL